jgi:Phospholipid methyltransferase
MAQYVGGGFFVYGVLLNLWTLQALGIKGMYNGDSFGHLMDAPVVNGPFRYVCIYVCMYVCVVLYVCRMCACGVGR